MQSISWPCQPWWPPQSYLPPKISARPLTAPLGSDHLLSPDPQVTPNPGCLNGREGNPIYFLKKNMRKKEKTRKGRGIGGQKKNQPHLNDYLWIFSGRGRGHRAHHFPTALEDTPLYFVFSHCFREVCCETSCGCCFRKLSFLSDCFEDFLLEHHVQRLRAQTWELDYLGSDLGLATE